MSKISVLLITLLAFQLNAADIYVDNVKGDDANPGSKEKPVKTLAKGMDLLRGGDTLHLTPNEEPYHEQIDVNQAKWEGSAEKPTVIDGHGATISLLVQLKMDAWKDEGNGIFSRHLRNNAWVMDSQGYWSGFPIVFFEGKPAQFAKTKEEMQELQYCLFKEKPVKGQKRGPLHNTLYIKLPEGKTPDDIKVEAPLGRTNIHVNKNYVTVKNITSKYAVADGFSSTKSKGLVFENVHGCYNMDQGMSHHGAQVLIKNSKFDHNAGCGVVDVYPECRTKYVNCIIEDDVYRGGVEFYKGKFEMENCIIRNNPNHALNVGKQAEVKLTNCTFVGNGKSRGVSAGDIRSFEMKSCTLKGFTVGLNMWGQTPFPGTVTDCTFEECGTVYSITAKTRKFKFNNNTLCDGKIVLDRKEIPFQKFVEKTGLDKESVLKKEGKPGDKQ